MGNNKLTVSYLLALMMACNSVKERYGQSSQIDECIAAIENLPSYIASDGEEIALKIIDEIELFLSTKKRVRDDGSR